MWENCTKVFTRVAECNGRDVPLESEMNNQPTKKSQITNQTGWSISMMKTRRDEAINLPLWPTQQQSNSPCIQEKSKREYQNEYKSTVKQKWYLTKGIDSNKRTKMPKLEDQRSQNQTFPTTTRFRCIPNHILTMLYTTRQTRRWETDNSSTVARSTTDERKWMIFGVIIVLNHHQPTNSKCEKMIGCVQVSQ